MNTSTGRVILAFLAAAVVAVVWGSIVHTQYMLAGLSSIGADVGSVRLGTTLRDIFSGFFPTYGGYVVAPSLLVAFAVTEFLARRVPAARYPLYALAGFVAILIAIPLVNVLSPLALLFGSTREWTCVVWMAAGGVLAGLLFAWMTRRALGHPVERGDQPHPATG